MTIETDTFVAEMLPRQRAAEQAIHNGDAERRIALWSRTDPVTVFGAELSASGWADVEPLFRNVAAWFSDSAQYEFEVTAAGASGDLAYTIGYEHNQVKLTASRGPPRRESCTSTDARTVSGASCIDTQTSHPPTTVRSDHRSSPDPQRSS